MSIGSVGSRLRKLASARGVAIRSDKVALDPSTTRHIIIRHGYETRSGQKAVGAGEIAAAATFANGARSLRRVAPSKQGVERVAIITRVGRQQVYAIYENRKKALTLVTMWVRG